MSAEDLKKSFPTQPSQQEVDDFVIAAGAGKEAEVTAFLDKYKDAIDRKNRHGNTALIYAACLGRATMVELLLERGADIDAQNPSGLTGLMCAAWRGYDFMVSILLDKGASLHLLSSKGKTAKMEAEEMGYLKIAALLGQRAEQQQRQEHERSEVKIKGLTDGRLEKLKNRRPPKPPFKNS
jgi:ankyrin repeat protein